MERSIVVEENHCKSNVNTVSKSDGPFIQIDSMSIDLVSAKDESDAGKVSLGRFRTVAHASGDYYTTLGVHKSTSSNEINAAY
nr:hypothetical protein CFP56_38429 [Quercus suber]